MKMNFKKYAQIMGVATACAIAFSVSVPTGSISKKALKARSALSAVKSLSPVLFQAVSADSGEGNIGNLFRMMAFLIVGFPDAATYSALTGGGSDGPPQNGMIGLINDIMGSEGLGRIFSGKYSACSELPSSGSDSATGDHGALTVSYLTPSTAIPSRFSGAGGNYQKSLSLNMDGTDVFSYEFDCDVARGIAVFNFPEDGGATRKIRLVFEVIDSVVKADFGMYYNSTEDERFALRLDGSSSGAFSMHFARVAKEGAQYSAIRAAGAGSAGDRVTGYLHHMQNLGGAVGGVTNSDTAFTDADGSIDLGSDDADLLFCYDFRSKVATVGACSGLALSAPNPAAAYPSSGSFTMANLASAAFVSSF